MDINLTGKRAIVCGSTQGIGKAVALELAALGCSVTLIARNEEKLKQVKSELSMLASLRLRQSGPADQEHSYIVVDFTNVQALKDKVHTFLRTSAPVHILVNNTGGPKGGPAINAELGEFTTTFAQHLLCNHVLVQAVVPGMKAERYGRIINIISTSVKQIIPNLGVSNTVRGAVANWSKTLAGELGPFGITVNNILPGSIKTPRNEYVIKDRAERTGKSIAEITMGMLAEIPAGRFAEPAELAYAVAFLASPAASFINGVSLPVDGGRTTTL
jgi:3-oxoacyl-[acyl-carrier protein] reductase